MYFFKLKISFEKIAKKLRESFPLAPNPLFTRVHFYPFQCFLIEHEVL